MILKMLFIDTETTGTDPVVNDIIQAAGKILVNGEVKEEFDILCQPFDHDTIEDGALKVNGRTKEELKTFPAPETLYNTLQPMFKKYVNPFNKQDKFIAGGQNVKFDLGMMHENFKKNGDDFFFSFVHAATFDTLNLAIMLEMKEKRKIFTPNYKLESICKCLGVKLDNAHNALADIESTMECARIMWKRIAG